MRVNDFDRLVTPLAILRFLGRREKASLHELAQGLEMHRNTLRPHVAALEDAGALATIRDAPSGRGRPALRYRLRPDWAPPTVDYRGLAELLAAAVEVSQIDDERLDGVGHEWGRYLLGRPLGGRADDHLPRALGRLGFSADVNDDIIELSACPCPVISPGRPELVCRLTAATVDGILTGASDERRVDERTNDHGRRRCTIRLR